MYTVHIHDKSFDIDVKTESCLTIDGEETIWDCQKIFTQHYHILHQHRGFHAEIVKIDAANKQYSIKINGRLYHALVQDRLDKMMEHIGVSSSKRSTSQTLKAPMPGLIVDIRVTEGDNVQKGTTILTLEAMKMENAIKSHCDGTIKKINVEIGEQVEKGKTLIDF